ncbi:MAG: hypothetical protein HQM15_02365 [Deltaproteobacteria bacterium]|nr:hypothetical protein [Deltaproteobacteria bacterium]
MSFSACGSGSSTSSDTSGTGTGTVTVSPASPTAAGAATVSSSTNFRAVSLGSSTALQGVQQSAHYRQIDPSIEMNKERVQGTTATTTTNHK